MTNETHESHEKLDRELRSLTAWKGESPQLWKRALDEAGSPRTHASHLWRFLGRPVPKRFLAVGVAAAAVLLIVAIGLPDPGKARSAARMVLPENESSVRNKLRHSSAAPVRALLESTSELSDALAARQFALPRSPNFSFNLYGENDAAMLLDMRGAEAPQETADRHVIRKVTMELTSTDVAATFLKARQLVSEAGGEYIEQSSLAGEGDSTRASLTLRVSASRLSDVLNELRKLGVVVSEEARGEDVTNQVVDLDARLRNERRVEQELLELLDSRDDSPLEEILKLRAEIAKVRTQIERYTAQQERLSRLVSLATVLVIIRPEKIEPVEVPDEASLWGYFKDSISDSWQRGVAFLADTVAGIVGVIVGGIVWWTLLIAVVVLIRRHLRTIPEPAP